MRRRTAGLPLGVPPAALARAAFEAGGGPGARHRALDGRRPGAAAGPRVPTLPPPGFPRTGFPEWIGAGAPLPPPDLVLPWGGDPGPATRDRRRRELAAALAACRFRDAAWFPALHRRARRRRRRRTDPEPAAGPAAAPGELVR